MAQELTPNALNAVSGREIRPHLVAEIDGIPTLLGSARVQKYIRIGDSGLEIGDDWVIGGLNEVEDQQDIIQLKQSTNTIQQQLLPDKGAISSVSSVKLTLLDERRTQFMASRIVSPGVLVPEIIGQRIRIWLGFENTAWPEDYIEIFGGVVCDIDAGAGSISIDLQHPDAKKRQSIFMKQTTTLAADIVDTMQDTVELTSSSGFLDGVLGPDGNQDDTFEFYVKIDSEIIMYTGISGNTLTGCLRGRLGTLPATHDEDANVESFYAIKGSPMDLALKTMLSGWQGPFVSGVDVKNFNRVSATEDVSNAIFFADFSVADRYGLVEGDYVTTTGAANGANNVTLKPIQQIFTNQFGSYVVIDGVSFVEETDSAATVSFRSKYDTLPTGLKMAAWEVDVAKHEELKFVFLSSVEFYIYLKDAVIGKTLIEEEIYSPVAAYSLPLRSRASVGLHVPPFDLSESLVFDQDVIKKPKEIRIKRGQARNYINTVQYKFDELSLSNSFQTSRNFVDQTSIDRFRLGAKPLVIDSKGLRSAAQGSSVAQSAANRRLKRYSLAAKYFEGIETLFNVGCRVEPGDFILFDPTGLQITDFSDGGRDMEAEIYEAVNRKLDLTTGKVTFDITDTQFDGTERYGLISPASFVRDGVSATEFTIKSSFASRYGTNEYRKWEKLIGAVVLVRSQDYTVSAQAELIGLSGNTVTLGSSLGFTPQPDYLMELAHYEYQPRKVTLLYTFMSDVTFPDGRPQYLMI